MAIPGYNNDFAVDYDKPGFCALCHIEIAYFEGSNREGNPILICLKGNAAKVKVRLNDGSSMGIMLCKKCKADFGPEQCREAMESIQRGWQFETENYLVKPVNGKKKAKWTDEMGKNHIERYRKLYIVDRVHSPWTKEQRAKIKKPRKTKQILKR